MMLKKELTFLVVFLISLPGCCGWRKKTTPSKKNKQTAQRTGVFSRVALPLASDGTMDADDASVRSFFDADMENFIAFDSQDDFDLEQAGPQGRGSDEYSYLNEEKEQAGLQAAYFDFDKYGVKPAEQTKAEKNARKLKQLVESDKDVTIVVEGHACASAGSRAYNLALSEKRAKSYADFLEANGVPSDRLKKVGRGKEMLVLKEGGREEQWVNRRVELHPVHDNAAAPAA